MNEYRIPLTPGQEAQLGWLVAQSGYHRWVVDLVGDQQSSLGAQFNAYHAPQPPPLPYTVGPVVPKDSNDAIRFYCLDLWRNTDPRAEALFDDQAQGYSATERNYWAADHTNQVAQMIAYHAVRETGDKSAATMAAMARSNAAFLPDSKDEQGNTLRNPLKVWADMYDGHWYTAAGEIVR